MGNIARCYARNTWCSQDLAVPMKGTNGKNEQECNFYLKQSLATVGVALSPSLRFQRSENIGDLDDQATLLEA